MMAEWKRFSVEDGPRVFIRHSCVDIVSVSRAPAAASQMFDAIASERSDHLLMPPLKSVRHVFVEAEPYMPANTLFHQS